MLHDFFLMTWPKLAPTTSGFFFSSSVIFIRQMDFWNLGSTASATTVMYKHFSSYFVLLLFISVIKVNLSQLLNIRLLLCSKYSIRVLKMINIWEYQNAFSDLSSLKYVSYGNDILFLTNYSDLSFLFSILCESGVPSSSLASKLALTQVFLFLTYFPSSYMNSSIIQLCLWSRKWKLYGKKVKFSN